LDSSNKAGENNIMKTSEIEMKQTYLNDGYCLKRDLIPLDMVSAARERVHEMIENQPDWAARSWQVLDPTRKQNSKGQPLPIGIQRPALHDPVFDAVARHPNLIAAAAELLGGEVELFTDQIGVKHGFITEEQGGCSFYHQDSYYWKIEPDLGVNCWIPLDEVGLDAIALGIMPGTQNGWELQAHEDYVDTPAWGKITDEGFKAIQRHRIPFQNIDFSEEIICPMQAGDGLFFTNYTWHRSEANRSGETKMFYAIAYQLTDEAISKRDSK
jgi:ectoine hydroxylase-related dioxygenase (phytanoyl-CoA dioxygenase family)